MSDTEFPATYWHTAYAELPKDAVERVTVLAETDTHYTLLVNGHQSEVAKDYITLSRSKRAAYEAYVIFWQAEAKNCAEESDWQACVNRAQLAKIVMESDITCTQELAKKIAEQNPKEASSA